MAVNRATAPLTCTDGITQIQYKPAPLPEWKYTPVAPVAAPPSISNLCKPEPEQKSTVIDKQGNNNKEHRVYERINILFIITCFGPTLGSGRGREYEWMKSDLSNPFYTRL